MNKKPIDKKAVLQKLAARLKGKNGATPDELKALNGRFDVLVKALSERLTTQIITKVGPSVIVDNLEKEFLALREKGLPISNIKDLSINIGSITKPEWYKEAPEEVSIKGSVRVEPQDQTDVMKFVTDVAASLVEFFGKLAAGTFRTRMSDEDFLKPQTFALYNPYTKKYVDPERLLNIINVNQGGVSSFGGGSGGYQPSGFLGSGQATVTTAGTRVQLPPATGISVTVKAKAGNAGSVFVGGPNVSASTGFILAAGESASFDVSNLSLVWLDAATNGDGVSYLYI